MLKRDGFQPTDPALFNAALASASATLSQQARSSASCSTFMRAKRRDSLLAHTTIPVPESQRRSLTVSPGSETLLFDEEMLGVVVTQVQQSSLISSNLAMSRSLARVRGHSSSSPVVDPFPAGSSRAGRPHFKRSSSSSRSRGRKRFKGGKRSAPSPEVGAITLPDPVRRLPVPPLAGLEGQGCGALGSGGPAVWLPHSFPVRSSSIQGSHLSAFVPPLVHQRGGAERLFSGPCGQVRSGASSSAVSRLLQPAVCSVEDLGVLETGYRSLDPQLVRGRGSLPLETIQSVLLSVRQGDWMASIDLKEAYLQIPVHPDSRRFLRFVAQGQVYQFSALCFGLSTAPQVFSRVMAPVSAILHSWGIRMRRYLDDWLVQSSSWDSLHDLRVVLDLCLELGIVVNPSKSHLVPSQVVQYLGVVIDSRSFRASPSSERVAKLFSTADAFLSCAAPPASTWLRLLGILSSLAHLVPGGRLRLRSLQLWDREDMSALLPWFPDCCRDLQWWLDLPRLSLGVSRPGLPQSGLLVRRLGRGLGCSPRLSNRFRPLGSGAGSAFHQRARELLAVQEGLHHFLPSLTGMAVSIFCDNSTAVSYLRKEGGTEISIFEHSGSGDPALDRVPLHSTPTPVHSGVSERPRRLPLSSSPASSYRMVPSPGGFSLFKLSLAGANRLVCHVRQSPMFCLFFSLPGSIGGGHRRIPPVLGRASGLRLPSVVHSSQGAGQAPCVSGSGAHSDSPLLASAPLVC